MFDAETDGRQETTRDDRSELMWIEKKRQERPTGTGQQDKRFKKIYRERRHSRSMIVFDKFFCLQFSSPYPTYHTYILRTSALFTHKRDRTAGQMKLSEEKPEPESGKEKFSRMDPLRSRGRIQKSVTTE